MNIICRLENEEAGGVIQSEFRVADGITPSLRLNPDQNTNDILHMT
jgi:hypothetical protein